MTQKQRAPRNRTLTLKPDEHEHFRQHLLTLNEPTSTEAILNQIICQDLLAIIGYLPPAFVDLLILDPPYNLNKNFQTMRFQQIDDDAYVEWASSWFSLLIPLLKPTASVYVCGDWRTSSLLYFVLKKFLIVRNRITWERDKGRGAKSNWKNNAEDIWFCTLSDTYTFNVNAVKLKRRVLAPYRHHDGRPKDWDEEDNEGYRLTHPSNLWTDISVPFWSMPENTDHPTQKPEKLIAKLVLASTNSGDVIFDPFLGSGTTAVVAQKLGRQFVGVELDETYACLAAKRLERAQSNTAIQGYANGVFWERNSVAPQQRGSIEKKNLTKK